MTCKECNFYCKEKRICVKTNHFEFPDMPICNEFIKDEGDSNDK